MSLTIMSVDKNSDDGISFDKVLSQIVNIEQNIFPNDEWSAEQFAQLLDNAINKLVVCCDESNQKIVGYCLYQQLFEEAQIFKIGTQRACQQQGIAGKILCHILNLLNEQQVQTLILEVREDNLPAIGFYQKHGFEQIALRKNYYANKDNTRTHALILQKKLLSIN